MKQANLKNAIIAFAIGAALLCSSAGRVFADDDHSRTRCQHRVEKAVEHYRHEVREHGKHSPNAENAKAKMNAEWDRCWTESHGWYDPDRHEWRTDRDWDHNYDWDYDHDHDHDR